MIVMGCRPSYQALYEDVRYQLRTRLKRQSLRAFGKMCVGLLGYDEKDDAGCRSIKPTSGLGAVNVGYEDDRRVANDDSRGFPLLSKY